MRDLSNGYGAQSVAQLDAKLERWDHQTLMDTNSLRLLKNYQNLAYQLSHYNQFHQKHQWHDDGEKTVDPHTKYQHKPINTFKAFFKLLGT